MFRRVGIHVASRVLCGRCGLQIRGPQRSSSPRPSPPSDGGEGEDFPRRGEIGAGHGDYASPACEAGSPCPAPTSPTPPMSDCECCDSAAAAQTSAHTMRRVPPRPKKATPRVLLLRSSSMACRTGAGGKRISYGARACAPGLVRFPPSPCLPRPDTRSVMLNAAPTPAPALQDPRSWGPRRLPPTPPSHPAARSIEYNRHCVQPGQPSCMPVPR